MLKLPYNVVFNVQTEIIACGPEIQNLVMNYMQLLNPDLLITNPMCSGLYHSDPRGPQQEALLLVEKERTVDRHTESGCLNLLQKVGKAGMGRGRTDSIEMFEAIPTDYREWPWRPT